MSAKKAPVAKTKKKKGGITGILVGVMVAVGAVAIMPTTLIFVVGMVPTAVAYFVDNSRDRTLGPTVCFLNFAGVLPALLTLWQGSHTMSAAIDVLSQPTVILVMLLPAAIGWLLYGYTPVFVGGILRRRAESRIRALEKEQESLVTAWGPQVKNTQARPEQEPKTEEEADEVSEPA